MTLGSNLFLHLRAVDFGTLTAYLDVGKAVDGSRQLTYECGESLVSGLVAFLTAGWHT